MLLLPSTLFSLGPFGDVRFQCLNNKLMLFSLCSHSVSSRSLRRISSVSCENKRIERIPLCFKVF